MKLSIFKSLLKRDYTKLLVIFLGWRLFLYVVSFLATRVVPLANASKFLGGGFKNYILFPEFYSWANFDGEHYLSIATYGYKNLEQAFFPVYPLLTSLISRLFLHLTYPLSTVTAGLLLSNLAFLIAIFFLWKLLSLDYKSSVSYLTIVTLILFPTSFYFNAMYSESLFLLFSVSTFLLARKNQWFWAGIVGSFASATRIFGMFLFPALLIEAYSMKVGPRKFVWIFLIPLGLIIYMFSQLMTVGDPLAFYHLQKLVGEQHQSGFIFLPQVFFRYIKMLITVDFKNPIYQSILLEAFTGILFFLLPIFGYFKKVRLSYIFYILVSYLTATIQGSFSSLPRYVIVFFPSFLILAMIIIKFPKPIKFVIFFLSAAWLGIESALFLRGYWVA